VCTAKHHSMFIEPSEVAGDSGNTFGRSLAQQRLQSLLQVGRRPRRAGDADNEPRLAACVAAGSRW
jgi:hypothetical protein